MRELSRMKGTEKAVEWLKYHVVDTTALLASTNPIYSAMEVGIAGMSDQVSIDSRELVAYLSYGGMGLAFARGRDLSRKIFGITDERRERVQTFHDMVYTAGFNLVVAPLIYLGMGASSKEAIVGGLSAGAFSTVMGPLMGYSIDVARDLTGLQESNRPSYPDLVKKQRLMVKKGLAALLTAGSIAAMAGIYALNPNNQETSENMPKVQEVIQDR